jgi:hypothetical protein
MFKEAFPTNPRIGRSDTVPPSQIMVCRHISLKAAAGLMTASIKELATMEPNSNPSGLSAAHIKLSSFMHDAKL